eukprot:Plantae.Rhodophyta-Hildenbrandia_rubra.ctg1164.p1 GENE.Plantae.Rhodophyta-Hildenbrandia_rubra.ctg1164~~Plantae.Rhodophyta-Hildenbrandia_rubra.ctg1164.p1  ORF type:complete len:705 (+),score=135.10 Plantae.Rhodophyta-Hildenbrandia_rubra.ctg1164:300-2414(+)
MWVAIGGLFAGILLPQFQGPVVLSTAAIEGICGLRKAQKRRRIKRKEGVDGVEKSGDKDGKGKEEKVSLKWSDVRCEVKMKKGKRKVVLEDVCGEAKPGRVLGIMGPSGSGKTSLLNVLAGRVDRTSGVDVCEGIVQVNGKSWGEWGGECAYVTQEDLFFEQLTVWETLMMAAKLRLPREMKKEEYEKFVEGLLKELGLTRCKDTVVGGVKTRGVSGGEMKRLSLGVELVSAPRLIFADEPTTGLDSFQARRVMMTMKKLADSGHTVVCSIHQPGSDIFRMCDDLVLLAEGKLVYCGPTDQAVDHFAEHGHKCPPMTNPAEYFLDLVSVDQSSPDSHKASEERISKLVEAFSKNKYKLGAPSEAKTNGSRKRKDGSRAMARIGGQIQLLFQRAWRQVTRDKKTFIARFMSSLFSSLLFGVIYWRIGYSQSTIQDRMGLLQVACINTAMTALVKTINVFPRERQIVNRERVQGSYSVFPYFISKLLAEMPVGAFFPLLFSTLLYPMVGLTGGVKRFAKFMGIITLESFTAASYGLSVGALAPNTEAALAIGPASMILSIVFGGFYVNDENVPKFLRWIPKVSLIKHAFEGLCVNEFKGLEFENGKLAGKTTGEQVLQRLSYGDSTVAKACMSQARVLAFNYLLTFSLLKLKKPEFRDCSVPKIKASAKGAAKEGEGKTAGSNENGKTVNGDKSTNDDEITPVNKN